MKVYKGLYLLIASILSLLILTLDTPLKYTIVILILAMFVLTFLMQKKSTQLIQEELVLLSELMQNVITNNKVNETILFKDDLTSKLLHQFVKFSGQLEDYHIRELEERKRLEQLIGDISHQLKTPLSNVILYQSLLIESTELEDTLKFTSALQKQTNKLEWLIESLLLLSRIESGCIHTDIKPRELNNTILEAVNMIHLKASKKNITVEYTPTETIVPHDFKWTSEAIFNVLDNAVKYSSNDERVEITVKSSEMFVTVCIRDYGMGIDPSEVNDLFKRFYRSPSVQDKEGIGIGLYLSQEIFNKQSGYIYAKKMSRGSMFELNLRK